MDRFKGKIVLVTGGNRNTGLDIVQKFVEEGAKVFMCGSSVESTEKGAAELAQRAVPEAAVQRRRSGVLYGQRRARQVEVGSDHRERTCTAQCAIPV